MFSNRRYLILTIGKKVVWLGVIGFGLAALVAYQLLDSLGQTHERVPGIVQSAGYVDGYAFGGDSPQAISVNLTNGEFVRIRVPRECGLLQPGNSVAVTKTSHRFSRPRYDLYC